MKLNPKEFALDRSRQVGPQILEILRSRILSMSLPPTTVLSRISLQSEFNVSQTPVRDALIRLEEEGLVEVYPQYATVVSRIDIRNAIEAHFLRLSIELEAVRRLTLDSPDETAASLEAVLVRQKHVMSPETYDLFDSLDKDFHRVLYERADILGLWSTVRRQGVHIDRLRMLNLPMPGKLEQIIVDHQSVVDAVRSGDAETAVVALRKHLSGTLSIIDLICEQYPDYVSR
ncbi:GntR family transcriptional regulator [Rhizobium sp. BK312]|uniref:GntR family transcriptional regulator n=1 Tax=unclassified Rhizobium TaxID=2613769 RepID=UPI000DD7AE88|nr:GntR family transcriptional regulator [Rhizobium sp. BK312]MBB3384207.1 DNA-binding GntR family transcriptional regulator [Rhizobium sp. BK098]MBB3569305.1 DNA-binding GntR family transcriptional regulator [Rhizobium sp. BK491]MBB3615908.1 DNA-binding GntR family transcriptional regulator [Rhizobium sp. BK609]MBB3681567.1 DNA-binding GntR family transcriptional regulator [Rhizobium sp. BK612]MBB3425970.1 DNA-binding GntR family transcriptional regulator [Rhizobium sp. BK312]